MAKLDISDLDFDALDCFEDEVDCAILNDDKMASSLVDMEHESSPTEPDDEDDVVDINVDYSDDIPSADFVDIDADDVIAAERDIAFDPFEDEDIIDAIDADEYFDLENLEDEGE